MKRLVFHPAVHSDVLNVMQYYENGGSAELAGEFYQEFRRYAVAAAEDPETFSLRDRGLRRVNLNRFPYHFLFRLSEDAVYVLVLRHNRRHPSYGVNRK